MIDQCCHNGVKGRKVNFPERFRRVALGPGPCGLPCQLFFVFVLAIDSGCQSCSLSSVLVNIFETTFQIKLIFKYSVNAWLLTVQVYGVKVIQLLLVNMENVYRQETVLWHFTASTVRVIATSAEFWEMESSGFSRRTAIWIEEESFYSQILKYS